MLRVNAETDTSQVERKFVGLYEYCLKADPSHVADQFYEKAEEMEEYLAMIHDAMMRKYGKPGDWKFSESLIQNLYDDARGYVWVNGEMRILNELYNKKDFVNHIMYAVSDKLHDYFSKMIYTEEHSEINVKDVDLQLNGNEISIEIVQKEKTGEVIVNYERTSQEEAHSKRIVKVIALNGKVVHGAKPYFLLPLDVDIVSCWVQQTGDHEMLWMIQNIFHCCAYTTVEKKDAEREEYRFWRDGQRMEESSDEHSVQPDLSGFIKVYFSVDKQKQH